jgi:uncharacterized protein
MYIPPFFIRILGDLIPKAQREQLISDVASAAQSARDTALLCESMNEQLQRLNEKMDSIQAVAVMPESTPDKPDQNPTPETIPFDELETVEVIEPDFSEHPKYDGVE